MVKLFEKVIDFPRLHFFTSLFSSAHCSLTSVPFTDAGLAKVTAVVLIAKPSDYILGHYT